MSRCRISLGNDRYVEVREWKGELRMALREWKEDKPMKKGISLTVMQVENWVDSLEYADKARAEKKPIWVTSGETFIALLRRAAHAWTLDSFESPKIRLYLPRRDCV